MFSKFFSRTKSEDSFTPTEPVEAFDLFAKSDSRFPIPNWQEVETSLQARLRSEDANGLWNKVSLSWMHALRMALGDKFVVTSSANFHLLSSGTNRERELLLDYAEKARSRVLRLLDGIALDDGYGKSCIMVFANEDQYYEYVANYYADDGEFALSGGMYLNYGYGHFVCVQSDMQVIEPVIAHELTHMYVSHLPIPAWLNEGLAVNTEERLSPPHGSLYTPQELHTMHAEFWNVSTIQEFWSGHSFLRPDEGNLLSYDLAKKVTALLAQDREKFVQFVCNADNADAGDIAARQHLGYELHSPIAHLLGDGDWHPNPQQWQRDPERGGFTSRVC